jgi:hypothetical protein
MPTRTLVGHLKICDGLILWADEDAHTLLDYPSGALTDMPFDDVLPTTSANEMKLPARGAADARRVVLRARHGHTIMADLRGERMDDQCVLWSFTPTASACWRSATSTSTISATSTRVSARWAGMQCCGRWRAA